LTATGVNVCADLLKVRFTPTNGDETERAGRQNFPDRDQFSLFTPPKFPVLNLRAIN